jgi:hypothetical protein
MRSTKIFITTNVVAITITEPIITGKSDYLTSLFCLGRSIKIYSTKKQLQLASEQTIPK